MARYIDADILRKNEIARCHCVPCVGSNDNNYKDLDEVLSDCPTANVAPKSEVAKQVLLELKTAVHNKAVYPNCQGDYAFINLKVFNAVLQNVLKKYTEDEK
jgi:hypothetical protein